MSEKKPPPMCVECEYLDEPTYRDWMETEGDAKFKCSLVKHGEGIIYNYPYCPIFCGLLKVTVTKENGESDE